MRMLYQRCKMFSDIIHLPFLFLMTEPDCEHAVCPVSNKRYIEMGCLPEYFGNACCPTSFTCRKLS